ncbi:MAG: FHA domain-containing protein [Planctomycetota bacterium]
MGACTICGEELTAEQKVCDVCGTSVPITVGSAPATSAAPPSPPAPPVPAAPAPPATTFPAPVDAGSPVSGDRVCPNCQAEYGPDHQDEFCRCGGELVAKGAATSTAATVPPPIPAAATPVVVPPSAPVKSAGPVRPAAGTACLVVYSEQKEPIHYCAINKDVTIIGRGDPVRGDFPDLDLGELFDSSVSRRISRKHVMVLRSRTGGTYSVRPLGGNTGTQIEKELATQLSDYPLVTGTRLVLGGVIRLKFEIIL